MNDRCFDTHYTQITSSLPITTARFIADCRNRFGVSRPTVNGAEVDIPTVRRSARELAEALDFMELAAAHPNIRRLHAVHYLLKSFTGQDTHLRRILEITPGEKIARDDETYETAIDPDSPLSKFDDTDRYLPLSAAEAAIELSKHLPSLYARFKQTYGAPYEVVILIAEATYQDYQNYT